jgi:hypothetical protein
MRFQVPTAASMTFRAFWDVLPCSHVDVALMMETVSTSETSVNIYMTTQLYNPEDSKSKLHSSPMFKKLCHDQLVWRGQYRTDIS